MKRSAFLCVLCLGLLATPAGAAVFERDWKTPGDGLLTYDDVNHREWLDVPESLLYDYGNFELVIAQTAPGGDFESFVPANVDDVIALAQSAGIDTETIDFATNQASTQQLIELLGPVYVFPPGGSAFTRGLLDELDPGCTCRLIGNIAVAPSGAGLNFFSVAEDGDDRPARITGVFLYRAAIPEPSTSCLALCSMLWLVVVRTFLRSAVTQLAFLFVLCFGLLTTPAGAAVFERDWKVPDDGLLTYDDVKHREWLDVPLTLLSQYSGTTEERYQAVVAQTAPGGLYEGFTAADSADVIALAQSAGIDPNATDLATNEDATGLLFGLLGETYSYAPYGYVWTAGMLTDFSLVDATSRAVAAFKVSPLVDVAGLSIIPFSDITIDRPTSITGVMLFREVPEPSCLLLAFAGLLFLYHWRRMF